MLEFMILNVWIMFAHFVADFVKQTDTQAQNKSSSNFWLIDHIAVYGMWMIFLIGIPLAFTAPAVVGPQFILFVYLNLILHFMTDYVSSRVCKRYWDAGDRHNAFVVIGFDQFAHYAALMITSFYFLGPFFL